jgi:hypothetical protein
LPTASEAEVALEAVSVLRDEIDAELMVTRCFRG